MSLLKERLRKARQEHGMSTEDVAKLFNEKGDKITSRSILSYELGEREPSTLYVRGLINYLQINPYWLLSNKGEMFDEEPKIQELPAKIDLSKLVFIPLMDMRLSAGYGAILQGRECVEDFVAFAEKWLSRVTLTKPEYLMAFTVSGDSMEGDIHDGDLVIANTLMNDLNNDGTYAVCIDDKFYVKILQRLPGNKVMVVSQNKTYQPFEVDLNCEHFKIIGKIIWSGKKTDC